MARAGADTAVVEAFLGLLGRGAAATEEAKAAEVPTAVAEFVVARRAGRDCPAAVRTAPSRSST